MPCDVIFIFGGTHPGLWETALDAYNRQLGQHIIITGGYKPSALHHQTWRHGRTPEAHIIRQELLNRGVPPEILYFEDRSTNSLENVLFAREVYDFSTVKSALVICKSYAVGRQCRTLRQQLPAAVEIIPHPFDTTIGGEGPLITRHNWWQMERSQAFVFGQLLKIIKYGEAGHLQPLSTISPQLKQIIQQFCEEAVWSNT